MQRYFIHGGIWYVNVMFQGRTCLKLSHATTFGVGNTKLHSLLQTCDPFGVDPKTIK